MSPPRRSDQSTAIAATSRARGPGRSQLSSGQSAAAAPAMPVPKVQNTSTQPVSRASAWQTQAAAITASMATRIAAISSGRVWTPAMSDACDSPDQLAQESLSFQRPLSGGDAQATAILVQHLGSMHHFGVALNKNTNTKKKQANPQNADNHNKEHETKKAMVQAAQARRHA